MDHLVAAFLSGVHNVIDPENIPKDAAQDAQNFVTQDGRTVLVGGRRLMGAAGALGGTTGFWLGKKPDGDGVIFCKMGTAIKYWDGSAWQNCITGLNATDQYVFQNYSSLAGAFTYVNGPGGYWKIVTTHPGSPIDVYSASKNFKGYILIDKGRTLLWNRDKDKTGLYGSWIDAQNSTVYNTVTNEALGVMGSTVYSGTLGFKSGNPTASAFGIVIDATTAAGTETFTDNQDGTLTSNAGGTGTINYATGAWAVTFNAVTTGAVEGDYQWEDTNDHGLTDFTHSATRVAGEGFQFPQDEGGDPILTVLIGQDGAYYSIKEKSAYYLSIDADDLGATNQVYRKDMGLPFFRAAVSTNKGIFFINTANPTKPEMTILQQSNASLTVQPKVLFKHFQFSDYVYDTCSFGSYDRWIVVFCRTADSLTNDRILMCNLDTNAVDIVRYTGNMCLQDGSDFLVADSVSQSVYFTFDGFDDLGDFIEAYWKGKCELAGTESLKKVRKLRFKGRIGPDQAVQVYHDLDGQGEELVGTIVGSASYVGSPESQSVGGPDVGSAQVGGDDFTRQPDYFVEMKVSTPKFRQIALKLVPTGIGYFDLDMSELFDVLVYERRIPKAFRQKQKVSLDGLSTDQ